MNFVFTEDRVHFDAIRDLPWTYILHNTKLQTYQVDIGLTLTVI